MKIRNLIRLPVLLAIMASGALALQSCATVSKIYAASQVTVSEQTADTLIISAEKATFIGKDTMDTFVKLDYDHRAAYAKISPKIHEFSVWLRVPVPDPVILPGDPPDKTAPRGVAILKTARVATKAFKANRTPENEANLRTAWKALQAVIDDCKKYTAIALTQPSPGQ